MNLGTLLIVDEDPMVREGIADCAAGFSEKIWRAKDGHEALVLLDTGAIDAVVTDLRMPGMDGLELIAHARARHLQTPFVFLTESGDLSDPGTWIEALRLGATDFIEKPCLRHETIETLQKALALGAAKRSAGSESQATLVSNDVAAEERVRLRRMRHATQMLRRYSKVYSNTG